jgi:hypothetical protein
MNQKATHDFEEDKHSKFKIKDTSYIFKKNKVINLRKINEKLNKKKTEIKLKRPLEIGVNTSLQTVF